MASSACRMKPRRGSHQRPVGLETVSAGWGIFDLHPHGNQTGGRLFSSVWIRVKSLCWRPRPESNRGARICSPLRSHSATRPAMKPGSIARRGYTKDLIRLARRFGHFRRTRLNPAPRANGGAAASSENTPPSRSGPSRPMGAARGSLRPPSPQARPRQCSWRW
jgi:hypothetical protein